MKLIEAIIRPSQLDAVKAKLASAGVHGLTITEVHGFGRQKGHPHLYRGAEYSVDLLPKVQLTILAHEDQVSSLIDIIAAASFTGKVGDGKIFISPVDEVIRIRTGESGPRAI